MIIDWDTTLAAVWRTHSKTLKPVQKVDPIRLDQLIGIDQQKVKLVNNTERFIKGLPANNALLWGARGTGKSSLIKAMLNQFHNQGLRIVELFKTDITYLPDIVDVIADEEFRFIIYSDDFSFDATDSSYIALKTVLEGSIEQPPDNLLFYATSNRRHLLPEYHSDNLGTLVGDKGELHYSDAVEEKISLADRFGLWLSFYQPNQENYLQIIDSYFPDYPGDRDELHRQALDFAALRASKSGRTAKQFYNTVNEKDVE